MCTIAVALPILYYRQKVLCEMSILRDKTENITMSSAGGGTFEGRHNESRVYKKLKERLFVYPHTAYMKWQNLHVSHWLLIFLFSRHSYMDCIYTTLSSTIFHYRVFHLDTLTHPSQQATVPRQDSSSCGQQTTSVVIDGRLTLPAEPQ